MLFHALLILALIFGGLIAYYSYLANQERQEAFRALALRLGGRYYPTDSLGLASRYEPLFPTLQQGWRRYA